MGLRAVVLAVGFIPLLLCSAASAAEGPAYKVGYAEPEFGQTKPPIGFVKFCSIHPQDCEQHSKVLFTRKLVMTPDVWEELYRVNSDVNIRIRAVSDQDLYGVPEFWTYPTTAGDCEDFVLLKKKILQEQGMPASSLLITVVLDENGDGHAVLTVTTKAGDYILDNRRDQILRWDATHYTYLKRQTANDPMQWVSVSPVKTGAGNAVASRRERHSSSAE